MSSLQDRLDDRLYRQVQQLPNQLRRARQRVEVLEARARAFGFHDLLGENPDQEEVNRSLQIEALEAKLRAKGVLK